MLRHLDPFLWNLPVQPSGPLRGNLQGKPPILHLKRRIFRHHRVMILLHRNHRPPKLIHAPFLIKHRKIRHKPGSLLHHLIIPFQKIPFHPTLICHLQHINNMRLLPDQQRGNRRRAIHAGFRYHLRPSGPPVPISRRILLSLRKVFHIPGQAPLQQIPVSKQRQIRLMPEIHLQMSLPIPAVAGKPRLLRRHISRRLQSQKILGQHDSPLQLQGPAIPALMQIYDAALLPELSPVCPAVLKSLFCPCRPYSLPCSFGLPSSRDILSLPSPQRLPSFQDILSLPSTQSLPAITAVLQEMNRNPHLPLTCRQDPEPMHPRFHKPAILQCHTHIINIPIQRPLQ